MEMKKGKGAEGESFTSRGSRREGFQSMGLHPWPQFSKIKHAATICIDDVGDQKSSAVNFGIFIFSNLGQEITIGLLRT
jgi:hypothetical protein